MQEQAFDQAFQARYTLKKLPMWGSLVEEGKIDF